MMTTTTTVMPACTGQPISWLRLEQHALAPDPGGAADTSRARARVHAHVSAGMEWGYAWRKAVRRLGRRGLVAVGHGGSLQVVQNTRLYWLSDRTRLSGRADHQSLLSQSLKLEKARDTMNSARTPR